MPGGDQTGPRGLGPMTGRGAGICAGANSPGFTHRFIGYGMGYGGRFGSWGGGRGWRHWYHATGLPGWARFGTAPQTSEQEKDTLKKEAEWLKEQLEGIQQRIEDLENQ